MVKCSQIITNSNVLIYAMPDFHRFSYNPALCIAQFFSVQIFPSSTNPKSSAFLKSSLAILNYLFPSLNLSDDKKLMLI